MDIVWNFLLQNDVSASEVETIKYIYFIVLMIPVVTTILALLRYVVGVKSVSIFSVIILTFAFVELGHIDNDINVLQGLKYGVLLYLIVFITSSIIYRIIKRFRMHYIPKINLIFCAVAIAYTLFVIVSRVVDKGVLLLNASFVLIAIATLAESISAAYARRNFKYAVDMGLRTLLFSSFCFIIISLDFLRDVLIRYPYVILVLILINIYLGRFKGLRLNEYWRFRTVLFSNTLENTDGQNSAPVKK